MVRALTEAALARTVAAGLTTGRVWCRSLVLQKNARMEIEQHRHETVRGGR